MYSNVSYCSCNDQLKGNLYQLWSFQNEGITPRWQAAYSNMHDEFIKALSSDVDAAISFFGVLNLDSEVDAFAIHFVDEIISNFKTKEEKEKFTKCINELSKKYSDSPYVNWNVFRFYSAMHAIEELNTDGEDNYD